MKQRDETKKWNKEMKQRETKNKSLKKTKSEKGEKTGIIAESSFCCGVVLPHNCFISCRCCISLEIVKNCAVLLEKRKNLQ